MNLTVRILICISAGAVLCQCAGTEKKKKTSTAEMSLAQRAMQKPSDTQRSQFEKYLTGSKDAKGGAGTWYQKQAHQSKNFAGGSSYAGQKLMKTDQSHFGKSRSKSADMTYSLGGKQAATKDGFKTSESRLGRSQSRDGSSAFDGSGDAFKTGNALTRSKGTPKAPLIIENFNDRKDSKSSAYTEDEVKRLINRN